MLLSILLLLSPLCESLNIPTGIYPCDTKQHKTTGGNRLGIEEIGGGLLGHFH